jgi:hypothetical protein
MRNCNFACCIVCVWNLVSHIKGRAWADVVCEQGAEEYTSSFCDLDDTSKTETEMGG